VSVTFNDLRSMRPTRVNDKVTRLPSARLKGLALARNNGRVACECQVPMSRANPYRNGSRLWAAFVDAYQETEAMAAEWNETDRAPYDTPVEVRTLDGKKFRARLLRDASMTEDEKPCDQWQAEEGEEYPPCWSDGSCWSSNEDGNVSDPVVAWRQYREQ